MRCNQPGEKLYGQRQQQSQKGNEEAEEAEADSGSRHPDLLKRFRQSVKAAAGAHSKGLALAAYIFTLDGGRPGGGLSGGLAGAPAR
jgi:hypothetical protein